MARLLVQRTRRRHRLRLQRRAEAGRPPDEALQDGHGRAGLDGQGARRVGHHDRPGDRAAQRDDGRGTQAEAAGGRACCSRARRGAASRAAPTSAASTPSRRFAQYLIVKKDGNEDGRFDAIARKTGAPLTFIDDAMDLGEVVKRMYAQVSTYAHDVVHAGRDGGHLRAVQLAAQLARAVDGRHRGGRGAGGRARLPGAPACRGHVHLPRPRVHLHHRVRVHERLLRGGRDERAGARARRPAAPPEVAAAAWCSAC